MKTHLARIMYDPTVYSSDISVNDSFLSLTFLCIYLLTCSSTNSDKKIGIFFLK